MAGEQNGQLNASSSTRSPSYVLVSVKPGGCAIPSDLNSESEY